MTDEQGQYVELICVSARRQTRRAGHGNKVRSSISAPVLRGTAISWRDLPAPAKQYYIVGPYPKYRMPSAMYNGVTQSTATLNTRPVS